MRMTKPSAEAVRALFGGAADLVERQVLAGGQTVTVFFLDGLTSGSQIADFVLRPLARSIAPGPMEAVFRQAAGGAVCCASMKQADSAEAAADGLVHGNCAVLFPGLGRALLFETKTGEKRAPAPPESENTVKGAKDAFTETMRTNTSLVRRHLRTPRLRLEAFRLGETAPASVTLVYLDGRADPERLRRMRERLKTLRPESLLSPAAVEELVTGSRRTAFPMLEYTERTDKFCQSLLRGRLGLIVDGLPEGFLAPVCLGRLMDSPEDRAVDYVSASCLRVLRYLALLMSLLLPAVYTAMALFHQQMLPTKLLLAIIESKKDVPFPTLVEMLALLAAFELLQEAGLHLPQAIGTAVSIIGGLVVGSAAVEARLVSPAALIAAASAGVCGFALPSRDLSDAVRVWRFGLTLLGGLFGLPGVTAGALALLVHLSGLESLGEAYLAPFSAGTAGGAVLRARCQKGDGT
jgi:spore germination protein KA